MTKASLAKPQSDDESPRSSTSESQISLVWIGTIATGIAALASLFSLPEKKVSTFVLMVLVVASWISFMPRFREWKYWRFVYAVAFSASIIVLMIFISRAKSAPQTPVHNFSPIRSLNFSPASGTIPWCSTFDGSGSIPRGDSLLIFDSPADSAGNLLTPVEYGFHGTANNLPNGTWRIGQVQILTQNKSDNGKRSILFGVLVTNQDAKFVKSITLSNGGYWRSAALPLGLGHISRLPVVRNGRLGC
jgi:Ca2+/Na+ antiporter